MKKLFFILSCICFFTQCGSNNTALINDITKAEEALKAQNPRAMLDTTIAKKAIEAYTAYAAKNTKDTNSANYLFKAAEILRGTGKPTQALDLLNQIVANHPSYSKSAQSLFLVGFTYENDLKNLEKAKESYSQFLQKYPKHDLSDDVQFSLDHLGKSPEEIVKMFEEKNKQHNDSSTTTVTK